MNKNARLYWTGQQTQIDVALERAEKLALKKHIMVFVYYVKGCPWLLFVSTRVQPDLRIYSIFDADGNRG